MVVLNMATSLLMADAVLAILGPDLATPQSRSSLRGPVVGVPRRAQRWPRARQSAAGGFGFGDLDLALVGITLVTAVPALVVARDEAASRPTSFSPLYGLRTVVLGVC